jgi:hypothetical protein
MSMAVQNIVVCHSCKSMSGADCAKSGRPILEHAENHSCPDARFKSRGVGDTLEKLIHWTGADKVVQAVTGGPCKPEEGETLSPCQKRRNWLNQKLSLAEGSD